MIDTALTKKQILKIVEWELMEVGVSGIEDFTNSEIEDLAIKIKALADNLEDIIK